MQTAKSARWIALSILVVLSLTMLGGPLAETAYAGAKGRRNTTIALGAATAYALLKGKKKLAIVGALGTAYAYKRYRDAKKRERFVTIDEAFQGRAVYDSRGRRYASSSRFVPGRSYYVLR
jgi:hypothetical protein